MRRHRATGQSLVEFALILPILLLIIMGVVDFGRAIYDYNAIGNAAREAGRTAIVNQYPDAVRAKAAQQATAVGIPTADPGDCPGSGGPTSTDAGTCFALLSSDLSGPCDSPPDVGCVAVVSVRTTYNAITPIIGNIVGPIPLVATTQQSIESVCTTSGCPR